jgi:hypothetical protein
LFFSLCFFHRAGAATPFGPFSIFPNKAIIMAQSIPAGSAQNADPKTPSPKTPAAKTPVAKTRATKAKATKAKAPKGTTKAETTSKAQKKGPTMAARRAGFLDVLRRTANISRAARESGICTSTAYRHRHTNTSFAAQWDAAVAEALDSLEEAIFDRVRDGVTRPVFYGGKEIGAVQHYSERLSMFVLKSKRPEIYNRPATATETGFVDRDLLTETEAEAEFDRHLAQIKARQNG